MIKTTRRSVVSRMITGLTCLLAASAFLVSGCSSAKRETKLMYDEISSASGACRKLMVVLPFENNVSWAAVDLNVSFTPELKKDMEAKYSGVTLLLPDNSEFPARFNEPALTAEGKLDGPALAESGRASGMNLILSGRLAGIRHVTEDRGMFWWAKVVHLAKLQMEITVYHTGTGARVLDNTVFHNIEITEAEGELIDAGKMPAGLPLVEALAEVSETTAKTACNVIKHIPWEGYVTSVDADRVVLSAGTSSGLKKGNVLKVFRVTAVTASETGQVFYSVGDETGSITVTAVYPDRTEAVVKEEGPIFPGSVVRTK